MTVSIIIITLLLFALSGIANGVMDYLSYRVAYNPYHPMRSSVWWNPGLSWNNKYKNRTQSQGPAFFLSTSALVFLTDGWHFFKMLTFAFITLAVIIAPVPDIPFVDWPTWTEIPLSYFTLWLVRAGSFHITFHHILTIANIRIMQNLLKKTASWFRALFSSAPFWVGLIGMTAIYFILIGISQVGEAGEYVVVAIISISWLFAVINWIRTITKRNS